MGICRNFINNVMPVDPVYEKKKSETVASLKKAILAKLQGLPVKNSKVDISPNQRVSFGDDLSAATDHGIQQQIAIIPLYEDACKTLMGDQSFLNEIPKGARFEVDQLIEQDSITKECFTELVVTLNWGPASRCSII